MNALRAEILDFAPSVDVAPEHDGELDPTFARAVNTFIRLDVKVKAKDKPYEALIQISKALRDFGVAHDVAEEFVAAIEEQAVELGVDFTQKARPTPMEMAIYVMDKEPELSEDKDHFIVSWDGHKKFGGKYDTDTVAELHVNGTKTTKSNVPKFEEMFAINGKRYLTVHLQKLKENGGEELDQEGMDLVTMVQAVGPVAASAAGGAAMKQAIETRSVPPRTMELMHSVAEMKSAIVTAKFEGAPEQAAPKIVEMKRDIPAQVMSAAAEAPLPPVMVKAVNQAMDLRTPNLPAAEPVRISANNFKPQENAPRPVPQNNNTPAPASAPKQEIQIQQPPKMDAPVVKQPIYEAPKIVAPIVPQPVQAAPVYTPASVMVGPVVMKQAAPAPVAQMQAQPQAAQPIQPIQQPNPQIQQPQIQQPSQTAPAPQQKPQAQPQDQLPQPPQQKQQVQPQQPPQSLQPVQQQPQQPAAPQPVQMPVYVAKEPEKFVQEMKRFEQVSPEAKAYVNEPYKPLPQERADIIVRQIPEPERPVFFQMMNKYTETEQGYSHKPERDRYEPIDRYGVNEGYKPHTPANLFETPKYNIFDGLKDSGYTAPKPAISPMDFGGGGSGGGGGISGGGGYSGYSGGSINSGTSAKESFKSACAGCSGGRGCCGVSTPSNAPVYRR